jgi:hypothetical protein
MPGGHAAAAPGSENLHHFALEQASAIDQVKRKLTATTFMPLKF